MQCISRYLFPEERKTDSCLSRPTITTSLDNALKITKHPQDYVYRPRIIRSNVPFDVDLRIHHLSSLPLSLPLSYSSFEVSPVSETHSSNAYTDLTFCSVLWKLILGETPPKFLTKLVVISAMLIRHRWHFWRLP